MRSCKCPECGATISVTDNTLFAKCEHCDSTVDLSDYRYVKVIERHDVDEAAILRAKAKAREIELEAEKDKRRFSGKAIAIAVWIALIVILWIASQFIDNISLSVAPEITILVGLVLLLTGNNKKDND